MGALLNMTAESAAMLRTRATVRAAYELINARLAETSIGTLAMPQGATDELIAADIAELITAYEAIADRLHMDEDDDLDTDVQAQIGREIAAAEEASWRRRTGPEVWWDRKTDRERRAAKLQTQVLAGVVGACILAVIEVILVLAGAR